MDVTRDDLSTSRRTWFSVAAVVFALIFGVALFEVDRSVLRLDLGRKDHDPPGSRHR